MIDFLLFLLNNLQQAYNYLRSSIQNNPNNGDAYILQGDIITQYAPNYGDDGFKNEEGFISISPITALQEMLELGCAETKHKSSAGESTGELPVSREAHKEKRSTTLCSRKY